MTAKKRTARRTPEKRESVLETLMKAASAYYANDVWSPGVQLAYLEKTSEYYAALHHYPKDPNWRPGSNEPPRRVVVFKSKAATIEDAILELAKQFSVMAHGAASLQRELAASIIMYHANHLGEDD